MAKLVQLTQLSPTMAEGVLAKWKKNEGDAVKVGDVLAEVETDKANMELEAFDKGVLLKRLVGEGSTIKVGAPIGIIGTAGEDVSSLVSQVGSSAPSSSGGASGASAPPKPSAPAAPAPAPAPPPAPGGDGHGPALKEKKAPPAPVRSSGERVFASPLARAIAREQGIDVAQVRGSGPGGRVVRRDVEALVQDAPTAQFPLPGRKLDVGGGADFEDVALSPMRKTIARRLVESKQKVPHFYLTVEADAAALKAFRAQANDGVADADKVSLNDCIVKCVAKAMRKVPLANASFIEQGEGAVIRRWKRVHVGVAVAIEDGLITPVVRDADRKALSEIAVETKDLIARARQKKLRPDEYTGGTISVSNLGMYGIEEFSAIINPPESTILAVGGAMTKPVVAADGKTIVVGERMKLTLSCDHRVVDGALGAQLLEKIKHYIEHPLQAVL